MVGQREAAIVHAVGLPYRERSHFDAQQVLESGGTRPYELSTGWLGRALVASGSKGLALNTTVPLVLRGRADVDTWAPSVLPDPSADLVARLERMYAGDPAWQRRSSGRASSRRFADGDAGRGAGSDGRERAASGRLRHLVAPRRRVPRPGERSAGGGARDRRLGHPCQPGQPERPARRRPAPARPRPGGAAHRPRGRGAWQRTAVDRRQRVRARGRGQRHARHRPRHRRRRLRPRRRGPGRPRRRRLAGAGEKPALRGPRPAHHDRPARRLKGVLGDHLQIASRSLDGRGLPDSAKVRPLQLLRG
jgi:hypothetical protein